MGIPTSETPAIKGHADAGPSAAERWLACPASVTLTRGIERASTHYAREGTAAHSVAEMILKGQRVPDTVTVEGESIAVTEDMLEHVSVYTRLIDMLRDTADFGFVEKRLSLDWWFAPDVVTEPVFGTADYVGYDSQQKQLTVVDLKYGQGHAVEIINNPQLMIYALMALGLFESDFPVKIQMVIVQPRTKDPIRTHTILLSELTRWADKELRPALARIGAGDTSESPGDWCRWCARAGTCSALTQTAIESAKDIFKSDKSKTPSPEYLSDSELSEILGKAELISAWVTSVRTEVETRIKNGHPVPGYKLVQKRAVRKWKDAALTEQVLLDTGFRRTDFMSAPEMLSVAQVEKMLKKSGYKYEMLESLITKESSGLTLARSDDAREGFECSPSSVFSPVLVGYDG